MGCCKRNEDHEVPAANPTCCGVRDREVPEGIPTCCEVRGRRCMCLPYDDGRVVTSIVLSWLAVFISWVWWATWILSMFGVIAFQVLWCCRVGRGVMQALYVAIPAVTSAMSLGVGVYVALEWREQIYCEPYSLIAGDKVEDPEECVYGAWSGVALACGILWGIIAICMFLFVQSGGHAKWEEQHGKQARNDRGSIATATVTAAIPMASVVEIGAVSQPPIVSENPDGAPTATATVTAVLEPEPVRASKRSSRASKSSKGRST